jgi:hypothetical protein
MMDGRLFSKQTKVMFHRLREAGSMKSLCFFTIAELGQAGKTNAVHLSDVPMVGIADVLTCFWVSCYKEKSRQGE